MAYVFTGDNPTQLYMDSLITLLKEGKQATPRGKKIKELRPVVFEFKNPLNRVTFLRGRKINPFFQQAEALWILAGRADVEWLLNFNKNMAAFSDDGKTFNAPYGERLRFWGNNSAMGFVFNPHDQLADVFLTLQKDPDSRQAYASIWNPHFDCGIRTTKDRACNVGIDFKIREGKLDVTVFNRSNDLHWGVFGANIVQFSTIQEVMAAWLGVEVGTYYQITNSLHIYLDDYGAKETDLILNAHGVSEKSIQSGLKSVRVPQFTFEKEPRIKLNFEEFDHFLESYFNKVDPLMSDDDYIKDSPHLVFAAIQDAPDEYFKNTLLAMFAYRAHRLGNPYGFVQRALAEMVDSQWKVSCLYFLHNRYKEDKDFNEIVDKLPGDIQEYIRGNA